MKQTLQNKKSKLTIIFFTTLFLCLWTISIFAGEKFCPYCGKETPSDARFCGYCGQELEGEKLPKIRHYGIGIGYGKQPSEQESISLSLYLDYVSQSGLGCQLNLALYYTCRESQMGYQIGESIVSAVYERSETFFVFPLTLKYQFGKAAGVSPYLGTGLCYSWYEYQDTSTFPPIQDKWDGIVPVFCGGINLFSNSPVELTCDGKYFWNPALSKASAFFLSILASLNWW